MEIIVYAFINEDGNVIGLTDNHDGLPENAVAQVPFPFDVKQETEWRYVAGAWYPKGQPVPSNRWGIVDGSGKVVAAFVVKDGFNVRKLNAAERPE